MQQNTLLRNVEQGILAVYVFAIPMPPMESQVLAMERQPINSVVFDRYNSTAVSSSVKKSCIETSMSIYSFGFHQLDAEVKILCL